MNFESKSDNLWDGIGIGGSINFDNDKYSIYAKRWRKPPLRTSATAAP
ncbi:MULTISPECIES: hypothetical protein [unclassified Mesorhizobium]|nr:MULTISPECIES: hypothetical protein [unclassified Mesorhizobium]MBZ9894422.1 hypothetical protein [Mesorhizobium sp. BR1-1-6]